MSITIGEAISYCPATGRFTWKVRVAQNVQVGDLAGSPHHKGYWTLRLGGKFYLGHRVAWFLMTGKWPEQLIDHRNLDRGDNRWENLREATPLQNSANRAGSGKYPKGVALHKCGLYQAQIKFLGKNHYLGLFDTPDQAHAAYAAAAIEHFGEFARAA